MDLNFDNYKRIDAFFKGELNKAEEQQLLEEIAANKELQEEFEFEKFLRGKTNAIPEEDIPQIVPVKKIMPLKYLAAACIAGILAIASFVIYRYVDTNKAADKITERPAKDSNNISPPANNSSTAINTDSLYKESYTYLQPTGNEPPEIGIVMLAYQQHDYPKVLMNVGKAGVTRSNDNKINSDIEGYQILYEALALAETGETTKAIKAFRELIKDTDKATLKTTAQWYLALQLIKQKKIDEASAILSGLATVNNAYGDKASALLKILK